MSLISEPVEQLDCHEDVEPDASSIALASALLAQAGLAATAPSVTGAAPAQPLTAAVLIEHRPALLRFARRKVRDEALAEDTVQEAMMAAIAGIDRFQGQSSLRTWLIGILHHKIQDAFRRETRYVTMASDDDENDPFDRLGLDLADETNDPLRQVADARMRAVLEREIDAMPQTLKEVFRMQALEGMPTPEVCEQLGISEANCWVRLHRARKHLAHKMRAHL